MHCSLSSAINQVKRVRPRRNYRFIITVSIRRTKITIWQRYFIYFFPHNSMCFHIFISVYVYYYYFATTGVSERSLRVSKFYRRANITHDTRGGLKVDTWRFSRQMENHYFFPNDPQFVDYSWSRPYAGPAHSNGGCRRNKVGLFLSSQASEKTTFESTQLWFHDSFFVLFVRQNVFVHTAERRFVDIIISGIQRVPRLCVPFLHVSRFWRANRARAYLTDSGWWNGSWQLWTF